MRNFTAFIMLPISLPLIVMGMLYNLIAYWFNGGRTVAKIIGKNWENK